MGRANETRTRTGCPFSFVDRGVSNSLTPKPRLETSRCRGGLIREEERVMDPRRPKRLTALLHEVVPNVPSPRQARNSERKLCKNTRSSVRKKTMKRWLWTEDRPSDRGLLFTGEGEGCEEPFERDGMTRQGRGGETARVEVRCALGNGLGTRFFVRAERDDGGFKWKN
ncbi:hypothetical protein CRG98_011728 [Punica granatum]|uniref:Uncharacterized protein n=1 Tax=Punica granatum TaxID=22663 RepID=A0A2I0KHB4_PUNGR|nr:hypothetical protein CRG98_011728 [Punica granatum]